MLVDTHFRLLSTINVCQFNELWSGSPRKAVISMLLSTAQLTVGHTADDFLSDFVSEKVVALTSQHRLPLPTRMHTAQLTVAVGVGVIRPGDVRPPADAAQRRVRRRGGPAHGGGEGAGSQRGSVLSAQTLSWSAGSISLS